MLISKLVYLADIFSRLNDLNYSLQSYCINIFTVGNEVMLSKKVVKKKYEKKFRNQRLVIGGMVADYSLKTKQEKIRIP